MDEDNGPWEYGTLEEIEQTVFLECLEHHNWERLATSRALDISVRTVRNWIRKLRSEGVEIKESPHRDYISKYMARPENRPPTSITIE